MFGKAGLGGLMKQAQQMQENMKKAQAKLAETEVEGEAGNGLVKVVMTCSHGCIYPRPAGRHGRFLPLTPAAKQTKAV